MLIEKSKFDELLDKINNGDNSKSSELLSRAEQILIDNVNQINRESWFKYFDLTRMPCFLSALKNREERYRWAETVFKGIRASNYSLINMISQRVNRHPEKTLFSVFEGNIRNDYSYKLVNDKIAKIAASLYKYSEKPSVALYMDNSIEGALTDIASLAFDIFISPLNVHFGLDNLLYIFNEIQFNFVVTDSLQRIEILKALREKLEYNFIIIYTGQFDEWNYSKDGVERFESFISSVKENEIDDILEKRIRFNLDDISSVMFTSGSTGKPKGVAFSNYNILTKRFARGAVFPEVGDDEVLLSYLPLFHTFGRYFEMLGMIYWGGNYVFAGRNDFESLIQLMPKVNPTGLVSIPLRWKQIYDSAAERSFNSADKKDRANFLKDFTGGNLRWGISAAGYLEPKVFKFFNLHGINLCSGFGMTEATGGISMTPPGEYLKDSVGIPLPGIKLRFSNESELQISGAYVAKYLEDLSRTDLDEYWMNTGDLFTQDENGYLYIIDRIKDIYKNSKGQTIAPAFIEKKFENIPGLKKAFLVGDSKPYNTLLIVPDFNDPFIKEAESQQKLNSYFGTLVSAVNRSLNPFERIVKFFILNRDFNENKGELTSKGTFKRKTIEQNFKSIIEELYTKSFIEIKCGTLLICIPFWALKDLGITENDLKCSKDSIFNKENQTTLTVKRTGSGKVRLGDYEYVISKNEIDLGTFILQPILWLGNKEFLEFFVCKEEWALDFKSISSQIFINYFDVKDINIYSKNLEGIDPKLKEINKVVLKAFYGSEKEILEALNQIDILISKGEHKTKNLLSRRLEALATHPNFNVRSRAYRILLFNKPDLDYNRYLPAFINSGLPFLNKKIIENIFKDSIEGFNLEAFRQRLEAYRKGLKWPAVEKTREQFKRILDLLVNFVHQNPSSYGTVRVELIIWILHKEDPALSRYAQESFRKLAKWFEGRFKINQFEKSILNWKEKVVFQDAIPKEERKRIEKILYRSTFLKEAFMLIFNYQNFDLREVIHHGIYISTISAAKGRYLYRISVNTKNYKHYDFVVLIKPDITRKEVLETIYLMLKISGTSGGTSVLPKLGNFRSKLGVISFEFINDLSVWERIRLLNSSHLSISKKNYEFELKLLFIRGIAAYFRVLKNSDYNVIPGNFSPSNSVVPESHFKKGAQIISITGWTEHRNFKKFFVRIFNNFYLQTYAHYPSSKDVLKISWMFDATFEALGRDKGLSILKNLQQNLSEIKNGEVENQILIELISYIKEVENTPYINSYLVSAIKSYNDWIEENPSTTKEVMEKFVHNLFSLYRIDKYPELDKYIFYSKTYYSGSSREVWLLFSKLINSLFKYPEEPAVNRIELAELQEALKDEIDKRVLNGLIYPQISRNFELAKEDESQEKEIVLKTKIVDSFGLNYTIRKPVSAFEIASLQKIFILDNYPIRIDLNLRYLVIIDDEDEDSIAGGLCYNIQYMNVAQLEGIDIAKPYRGRELSRKLIEDFFSRSKSDGIKLITTYFYLNTFFEKFGFYKDNRWGGLVKEIN